MKVFYENDIPSEKKKIRESERKDCPYVGRFGPGHRSHEDIHRDTVHCRGRWAEGKKYSFGHFQLCNVNKMCDILKGKEVYNETALKHGQQKF